MRKNKLIQLLQDIEGNPDILLWNGMVGDWMDIQKPIHQFLYKMTLEHYLDTCKYESKRVLKDPNYQLPEEEIARLTKCYKTYSWEDNEWITQEDINNKKYKCKKVVYLQHKPRGIKSWDRFGDISY
jgi:hypothetical protein